MPHINLGKKKKRDRVVNKVYQQSFYQSKAWKRLVKIKRMVNPVCERCESMGFTRQLDEIHHKVPWETGATEEIQWGLFTDYDNLESVCGPCHDVRHTEINKRKLYL